MDINYELYQREPEPRTVASGTTVQTEKRVLWLVQKHTYILTAIIKIT